MELKNLFELSLEELMDVEVTTASQEKEKASESLAIVSVLTAAQLKQMGALNLYEALSFLPGIQINESYIGYSVLTFRGVTPGLYNNKALFMVNGHPVHEKVFGSSHFEFLPLEMVDKIEVVRSPASVLYGTNAISGVVNVITKQGLENANQVAARVGSNEHYYGSLSIHDAHISMGGSVQKDSGYDFDGTFYNGGEPVNKKYQNDINNLFIDAYGEQWRLQAAYFNSQKEKLGLNTNINSDGINDYDSFYVDANKAFTLGSGTLNLWLRYDYMDKNLEAQKFPNPSTGNPIVVENDSERYSGEIQYKDYAFENLRYIVGALYEYDKTRPLIFVDQTDNSIHPFSPYQDSHTTRNLAFYTEAKYRFNDKFVGIAGFRVEDNSDTGTALNPRVGVNYEYSEETYFKLLYSEAYRSPTFLEKYAEVPGVLIGNRELNREKIKTIEAGVDSKLNANNSLQLTLYYLELKDEITRRSTGNGNELEYFNSDGIDNYGLEAALHSIINESCELTLNASYVDGEHNADHSDGKPDTMNFVANYTANAIFTYHLNQEWSSSLSSQYVGNKDFYRVDSSGQIAQSGVISDYILTNITLSYQKRPFEANLYLKNIFDEDYTYPEPVSKRVNAIPGGPGASAYLTLRYYF